MAKFNDLSESILNLGVALKNINKDTSLYNDDAVVLDFLSLLYKTYWSQIHEFLVPKNTDDAESQIRFHLRNIDKNVLPFIEKKIDTLKNKTEIAGKYFKFYDDFYALMAFRSLKHFALYSEWGESGTKKTHWRDTLPVFSGFWYYAGKMVLGNEIQFIEKQFPTGYGKCVDENTIVRTPNGNIKIKDINVGDNIYSMKDNRLCVEKVIDKTKTFKSQITIKTRGGIPITVSPEHRLLTQNGYKEAKNITRDDYLYRQCCIIDNDTKIYENDKSLEEIIYKDFVWDKITVIEKNETKIPMIDISVSNTNNFIANGIVSHNSYSDAVLLAFIFGNNISDDCLKVFGASENVSTFTMGLVDIMIKPLYMKVFPYYRQFNCDPDKMFVIRQIKDTGSKLRIYGSDKLNLRVVSKDKNTNGIRARWLFLDDITQLIDAYNSNAHKKDIFKLTNEWYKRNYNLTNFKVVAGGTTYSNEDILSWLLERNNIYEAEIAKEKNKVVNKYTKIANSNYILENGKSVFVCVPKLDWDTDKSTFPENFPTETARRTRAEADDGGRMFEAMEQQRPMPSEATPFCYENLKTYKELPKKENEGGDRSNYCTAAMDLPRTGKNNLSMPIFSNCNGIDYVVDFLYEKIPLDHKFPDGSDTIDMICQYIIKHNVISLIVETNTNSNIDSQITERLKNKYGWLDTKIFTIYSTEKKEEKIYSVQGTILSSYRFPERNMFSPNSMMGKAMRDMITWDGKPNRSDDSIDSIAIHSKKYHKFKKTAQVEILKRRNW